MTETEAEIEVRQKTKNYLAGQTPATDAPRITQNPDVWLQENVAILTEVSTSMVHLMVQSPKEAAPFVRLFALVTQLAADSKKMLQQGGGGAPPVAPVAGAGDNGGMEKRVEALEKDMKDVLGRLTRVETKLDTKVEKSDLLATEVKLILLGAGAWASLLFVLAKGFKWF